MSVDAYIAGPNESRFDLVFQCYGNGDVGIPTASPNVPPMRLSAASAKLLKEEWANTGALVVGRHLYNMTNACSPTARQRTVRSRTRTSCLSRRVSTGASAVP